MAPRGFLHICLALLMSCSYIQMALASGRRSLGLSNGPAAAPRTATSIGLCASAITIHGYKCEEHEVTTEDGYILSLQRIPGGRGGGSAGTEMRPPVIIQHGLFMDAQSWLINLPEQNLPMILADEGFDVWISNTRGTRFSRKHTSLNSTQNAYWNWSWDELMAYDQPAVFDYVYKTTGQKTHYIGHSLGTLVSLTSLSEGKLVDKLKSTALLSPIAYLSHMTTQLTVTAAEAFVAEDVSALGFAEFSLKSGPAVQILETLCFVSGADCYELAAVFTGANCCLNATTLDLFLSNEPQPTATKNLVHLSQTIRDEVLAKYNYGTSDNNVHYGQATPPVYNLSNIPRDIPMFLSYGGEDALSDVEDVKTLLKLLKSHDADKLSVQFVKEYGHMDFIMATNAKDIVYNQVVSFFKRHH